MPIKIAELLEAQRPLKDRILEVLQNAGDEALGQFDIYNDLDGMDRALGNFSLGLLDEEERVKLLTPIVVALQELVQEGKVRSGNAHGVRYYYLATKGPR
jgi:hypothetical protein